MCPTCPGASPQPSSCSGGSSSEGFAQTRDCGDTATPAILYSWQRPELSIRSLCSAAKDNQVG